MKTATDEEIEMATIAPTTMGLSAPASPPTWTSPREALRVTTHPTHLKKTITIALVIGSVFFAINQLGTIVGGHATVLVWAKGALTYLTPFLVSNYSILVATRARN